jgi:photosystem II PsbZ protein
MIQAAIRMRRILNKTFVGKTPRFMTILFQFVLYSLIIVSWTLVLSVPVAFALPQSWSTNKRYILTGTTLWVFLLFTVALLNSFV